MNMYVLFHNVCLNTISKSVLQIIQTQNRLENIQVQTIGLDWRSNVLS